MNPAQSTAAPSRNAPCPCGSGEKYKRCCGAAAPAARAGQAPAQPAAPATAQQNFTRGIQALRAGQPVAAMQLLLTAIQDGATQFEAFHGLGTAMLQTGRFAQASGILAHAVTLRPDSAAAYWDLGASFDHQNLHEPAIAAYARAVELAPRLADVQLRLGQLYAMYSRNQEAAGCLEKAADARPKTTEARLYRVDAALLRGDAAQAEAWARKAVALAPASPAAQGALAGALIAQGRFSEAEAGFEAGLRIDPHGGRFWLGLAQCRRFTPSDSAILHRLDTALNRPGLPDEERMAMHFAKGKILDDCGDYAAAMRQFDAANAIRGQGLHYDHAALAASVDQAISTFTPAFFARPAPYAAQDATPVFIVGMYRSGTTLVEQILSSHPGVAAGGELTVWLPSELDIDPAHGDFDAARASQAVAKYLSVLGHIGPNAARVTDKLPANLFRLGAIHALLPRAKIIHCRRHPADVCLSIYTTNFSARLPFAARRDDLAFYCRQNERMIAHWREVLPQATLLEIDYENLVADREAQTRRLIDFVGLDWNDACLQPERNSRAIGTASAWQARQPVYATSVERWRRYPGWARSLGFAEG